MNKFIFVLTILLVSTCGKPKEEASFDWMLGSWVRTNNSKGAKTYESWTKKSKNEYIGFGCTLKDKDTVFKEELSIIKINNIWNLEVFGVNETSTLFKFISNTTNSFTCQNLQNEFPKKISYSFDGEHLKAIISDDTTEIPFLFKQK